MNCGFNYSGCGCNSYNPFITNPFGCGGCNSCNISSNGCGCGCGGFGSSNWFAIVLVVFLLLTFVEIQELESDKVFISPHFMI